MIAIVTAIVLLISNNVISVDAGIIYGALFSVVTIIAETLIPTIIGSLIAPKVSLKIDNIQIKKKTYQNVEGHLITALVTNKGKKIALKLDANVQIKTEQNEVPNLLYVHIRKRGDTITSAEAEEQKFDGNKYAWVNDNNKKTSGSWAQLRQGDHINLLFPYEWHVSGGSLDSPIFFYGETLLDLKKDISYEVIIEVKGENAEKTTERGKASKKISLSD